VNGYLLDTNVLSALAPERGTAPSEFLSWLESRSAQLFVSVISVVEIEAGVKKLQRAGATKRAEMFASWLDRVVQNYSERLLPFDLTASRLAGAITDRVRATGNSPGFADIAIAATAERFSLLLLTANVRHFAPTGIRYVNPFESLPD
jgi:predicted nucleic acid-binding protein